MNIGIFEGGHTPLAPNIWARVIHYTINLYSHTIHEMQSTRRLGGEPGGATTYPDNPWWDLRIGFSDNRQALNRTSLMRSSWINLIPCKSWFHEDLIDIHFLLRGRWWDFLMTGSPGRDHDPRPVAALPRFAAAAGNTAQDYYTFPGCNVLSGTFSQHEFFAPKQVTHIWEIGAQLVTWMNGKDTMR